MINCIIFSKDRAMQVDSTLRSFFTYCQDWDNVDISVLYTCSNDQHYRQYQQLLHYWNKYPKIAFFKENRFRQDLVNILNKNSEININRLLVNFLLRNNSRIVKHLIRIITFPKTDEKVLFLVDDTIFTSEFSVIEIASALDSNPEALGFSLRLGRNISYCYMQKERQPQPEFEAISNNILKYNWNNAELDFNYPLEISSSVYRMNNILESLLELQFTNPNLLEGALNCLKMKFVQTHPNLLCFSSSVAFCNPINIVQTVSLENRHCVNSNFSANELANLFDEGKRINLKDFHHLIPNACHMEMGLSFRYLKEANDFYC